MKKLGLVLGTVISLGMAHYTAEASFNELPDLDTLIIDEENGIYMWELPTPQTSFYETRATVKLATFDGTATPNNSIISNIFNIPDILKIRFNYESPQTYKVEFSVTVQKRDSIKGWIDVTSYNFTATAATQFFGFGLYSSNTTGPYRVVVGTPDTWGVKITNSSVTYEK